MLQRHESNEMSFSDVQGRLRDLGYYEDLLGEGPRRATLAVFCCFSTKLSAADLLSSAEILEFGRHPSAKNSGEAR